MFHLFRCLPPEWWLRSQCELQYVLCCGLFLHMADFGWGLIQ